MGEIIRVSLRKNIYSNRDCKWNRTRIWNLIDKGYLLISNGNGYCYMEKVK